MQWLLNEQDTFSLNVSVLFYWVTTKNTVESIGAMSKFGAELRASLFTRVNYDFWCIKMKIIFKSHNLWKFIEEVYELPSDSDEELTEKKQIVAEDIIARDARALGFIQRADSDEIFPRVANQETAKTAWISKNIEVIHMSELWNYKVFDETLNMLVWEWWNVVCLFD